MFVDTSKFPVSDDAGNTIFIKPRMDFGAENQIATARMVEDKRDAINILYEAMIVGWQGPAFKDAHNRDLPCTPEHIRKLDPANPLVIKLREEIGKRAQPRESPDPNAVSASGVVTTGGNEPRPNGTVTMEELSQTALST